MSEQSSKSKVSSFEPHPVGIWPAILFLIFGVYSDQSLRSLALFGMLFLVVCNLYFVVIYLRDLTVQIRSGGRIVSAVVSASGEGVSKADIEDLRTRLGLKSRS